jgi:hypothetical protein
MAVYTPIEVGDKQPNQWLLFDRYAPVGGEIGAIPNNWSFGSSSNYVAPFTSWSQQIVNATYDLGPYARRVSDGASGRIIISTKSPSLGEIGFVQQCWYGFDDTPYNTDDGSATGNRYLSKTEWWEACVKTTVCLKDLTIEGHPSTAIEVAIKAPEIEFQSGTTPPSYLWSGSSATQSAIQQFASPVNYGSCGVGALDGLPEGIFGDDAGVADDGNPSGAEDGPFAPFTNAFNDMLNAATGNMGGLGIAVDAIQNAVNLYTKAFYLPHKGVSLGVVDYNTGAGFDPDNPIIWRPSEMSQKRWLRYLDFDSENCNPNLPSGNQTMPDGNVDPSWFLTIFNRAYPNQRLTRIGDEFSMKETYGFTPSPGTDPIETILKPLIGESASNSIRTFLDFSPLNVLFPLNIPLLNAGELETIAAQSKIRLGIPLNLIGGNFDIFKPTTLDIRFSLKNISPDICSQYATLCGEDICNLGPDDDKIVIC